MTFRSPQLLATVRTLPCMNCGRHGHTQAAHSNQLRFGKGRGLKASDAAIMALCTGRGMFNGCHEHLDQTGAMPKPMRYQWEFKNIALTLWELIHNDLLIGAPDLIRSIPPAQPACETSAVLLIEHIEAGNLKVAK